MTWHDITLRPTTFFLITSTWRQIWCRCCTWDVMRFSATVAILTWRIEEKRTYLFHSCNSRYRSWWCSARMPKSTWVAITTSPRCKELAQITCTRSCRCSCPCSCSWRGWYWAPHIQTTVFTTSWSCRCNTSCAAGSWPVFWYIWHPWCEICGYLGGEFSVDAVALRASVHATDAAFTSVFEALAASAVTALWKPELFSMYREDTVLTRDCTRRKVRATSSSGCGCWSDSSCNWSISLTCCSDGLIRRSWCEVCGYLGGEFSVDAVALRASVHATDAAFTSVFEALAASAVTALWKPELFSMYREDTVLTRDCTSRQVWSRTATTPSGNTRDTTCSMHLFLKFGHGPIFFIGILSILIGWWALNVSPGNSLTIMWDWRQWTEIYLQ